jgi:hypothetical protein
MTSELVARNRFIRLIVVGLVSGCVIGCMEDLDVTKGVYLHCCHPLSNSCARDVAQDFIYLSVPEILSIICPEETVSTSNLPSRTDPVLLRATGVNYESK